MFSKACEYGIKATIFITKNSLNDKRVRLNEIAKGINSPAAFTAKILQQLAKQNVIKSIKGPTGGFEVDKERMKTIMMNQIVDAIDGDSIYKGCGLGLEHCNAHCPCPVHEKFSSVRDNLRDMLESTSLHELALGLENGVTVLKR